LQVDLPTLAILLPAGISFYTFQTMGYAIDVYRRQTQATDRFPDFLLYVSFFPQLVMGPIERSAKLLPQFMSPRAIKQAQVLSGLQLAVWGYFKKVVIADNLADIVDQGFSRLDDGWFVLLGTYAFAIQIYCDFSAYTDIARGVARMLGIDLRQNFRLPYFATSPREFWQRWHISLSTWLRRLPLHSAGRQPARHVANDLQPDAHHVARRIVAWCRLELRILGCLSRRLAGRVPGVWRVPTRSDYGDSAAYGGPVLDLGVVLLSADLHRVAHLSDRVSFGA